jgi:hypothetical protein
MLGLPQLIRSFHACSDTSMPTRLPLRGPSTRDMTLFSWAVP